MIKSRLLRKPREPRHLLAMVGKAFVAANRGKPMEKDGIPVDISLPSLERRAVKASTAASGKSWRQLYRENSGLRWEPRSKFYAQARWQYRSVLLSDLHVWPGFGGTPKDIATGTAIEVAKKFKDILDNQEHARYEEIANTRVGKMILWALDGKNDPLRVARLFSTRPLIVVPKKFAFSRAGEQPEDLTLDDGSNRAVTLAYLQLTGHVSPERGIKAYVALGDDGPILDHKSAVSRVRDLGFPVGASSRGSISL